MDRLDSGFLTDTDAGRDGIRDMSGEGALTSDHFEVATVVPLACLDHAGGGQGRGPPSVPNFLTLSSRYCDGLAIAIFSCDLLYQQQHRA